MRTVSQYCESRGHLTFRGQTGTQGLASADPLQKLQTEAALEHVARRLPICRGSTCSVRETRRGTGGVRMFCRSAALNGSVKALPRGSHAEPELPKLPRLLAASERATLLTSPPLLPGSRDRRARGALACNQYRRGPTSAETAVSETSGRKHTASLLGKYELQPAPSSYVRLSRPCLRLLQPCKAMSSPARSCGLLASRTLPGRGPGKAGSVSSAAT